MSCSSYDTIKAENRKLRSAIQGIVRRIYENDSTISILTIASILKELLAEEAQGEGNENSRTTVG